MTQFDNYVTQSNSMHGEEVVDPRNGNQTADTAEKPVQEKKNKSKQTTKTSDFYIKKTYVGRGSQSNRSL